MRFNISLNGLRGALSLIAAAPFALISGSVLGQEAGQPTSAPSLPSDFMGGLGNFDAASALSTALSALDNLSDSYPGILLLFEAICYVGGLFILAGTLLRMSRMQPHEPKSGVIVSVVTAVVLMAAPATIGSVAATIFADQSCSGGGFFDYMKSCEVKKESLYTPILQFIQFYGFFSFVRGWFLINKASKPSAQDPDGTRVKGGMHVFFGVLCIHIEGTLTILAQTFGFSWLSQILG